VLLNRVIQLIRAQRRLRGNQEGEKEI